MPVNKYFIKDGYRERDINNSLDTESGEEFWNAKRIATSLRYQYYVYRRARQLARKHGIDSLADVGCGVATKLNAFFAGSGIRYYGIDQASAIEICRKWYDEGTFIDENLEEPRYLLRDHEPNVGMVICSDVIEHMADPDELLDYIKAISTPETLIVLSTPERDALRGKDCLEPLHPKHVREWSRDEFRAYLRDRGFTIREEHVYFPFQFKIDRMTYRWLRAQWRGGNRFCTNMMMVATIDPA